MVDKKLFVEGAGNHNPVLKAECRRAFAKLFERAGITRRPAVIPCGGRRAAYDQFCNALEKSEAQVWLLVDSEERIAPTTTNPWDHVRARVGDAWPRPPGATDEQLQFMAVCTETWLLADAAALRAVFGRNFVPTQMPAGGIALETVDKDRVYDYLEKVTTRAYAKNSQFKVLYELDPSKLRSLPWAKRFLDEMSR